MATSLVEGEGNSTPLSYAVFGEDVQRSDAQYPKIIDFSFTDQFLHAVRLWQTTADVPHQPHGQPEGGPEGFHDADHDFEVEFDNLDVLQDFPGDQEWIFFRPDPNNLGRRETLELRATAVTTMREIEQSLAAAWPDLLPGRADWEIQMVVHDAFDALHAPLAPGQTAFIVKAQVDLDQGLAQRSVILLSLRSWILTTGWATSSPLRAFVLDTQNEVAEFFQSIDFQGRCDLSPCAIEHNG